MYISHVSLKNWRNFRKVDTKLHNRTFIIGPNASGKSNFLDVFKFLHDIAKPYGGGLQKAISDRGGIPKLRCLSARQDPDIEVEVHLSESPNDDKVLWKYAISIKQKQGGHSKPYLVYEKVYKNDKILLERPDPNDKKDPLRLSQTYLEQINANENFREISGFFESISYLHLIPQLLRYPNYFSGFGMPGDPFGQSFLERVAKTSEKTRKSRLNKIEKALSIAIPQLKKLTLAHDKTGKPHLEAIYDHWRPNAGKQREDQFSDGTLRLIGLLWSILEKDSLLLLEEPELSLHSSIISHLPSLINKVNSQRKNQIILSTHSNDMLSSKIIRGEQVLLLIPKPEGTEVILASSNRDIKNLLESGMSVADAVSPYTKPIKINDFIQLSLF